jgi:hypothetical protein
MTFSNDTLTLLVLIALGLAVLAVLFSITGSGRRVGGEAEVSTGEEAVGALLERIDDLERSVRALHSAVRRQQVLIDGSVRRVALVRYDAFEDVGGRLSFSCALLDDHGTGIVLTSINGRQDTRVYAKPVVGGTSSHNLSLEEEEAIRQAMAEHKEPTGAQR